MGIGDDGAVLRAPDGRVVASTDLLVEGWHFRRDWSSATEIGGKAAAQNLADIAAMGAVPTALLVGLATPGDLPVAWAEDLAAGLAAGMRPGRRERGRRRHLGRAGADAGRHRPGRPGAASRRSPAPAPGPGTCWRWRAPLGRSAAGLALLQAGLDQPASLLAAHRWPHPDYAAGPEAARLGATSMIDVSDGLVQDVGHLAEQSGVRIDLESGAFAAR